MDSKQSNTSLNVPLESWVFKWRLPGVISACAVVLGTAFIGKSMRDDVFLSWDGIRLREPIHHADNAYADQKDVAYVVRQGDGVFSVRRGTIFEQSDGTFGIQDNFNHAVKYLGPVNLNKKAGDRVKENELIGIIKLSQTETSGLLRLELIRGDETFISAPPGLSSLGNIRKNNYQTPPQIVPRSP